MGRKTKGKSTVAPTSESTQSTEGNPMSEENKVEDEAGTAPEGTGTEGEQATETPTADAVDTGAAAVAEPTGDAIPETPAAVQTPPESSGPAVNDPPVEEVAAPAPVAEPVAAPAPAPAPAAELTPSEQATAGAAAVVEAMKTSDSPSAAAVVQALESYAERMRPGVPLASDEGARYQVGLWRTLRNLIDSDTEDFQQVFSGVLAFAHLHEKGSFADTHLFRFTESLVLGASETKAFLAILNLIKTTADPRGRKHAMKQIDFERSMEHFWNERSRQRVAGFFNL